MGGGAFSFLVSMATATMTLPNHPPCREFGRSKAVAMSLIARAFDRKKLYSHCSFVNVRVNNFRGMAWQIRSSVDTSEFEPSPSGSTNGNTRLVRAVQDLLSRINARIQEIRKSFPLKLLFFLVGFYCATAFATVIGQTGDWDILSAAFAVVIVEGIGALMYRASSSLFSNIRSLITMFNYWKAGLALGLFLDSFKY